MQRAESKSPQRHRIQIAALANASLAIALLAIAGMTPAIGATLDQVRTTGKLLFGYRADARPFSYDESGKAAGYSVELCGKIADDLKVELGLSALTVEWVPVTPEDRFRALQGNKVDILCGADSVTLERRKEVSFSIPIFPSGIGAIVRWDAPAPLREVLSGQASSGPIWRASPALILSKKTFSAVAGTTGETWLAGRLDKFKIDATAAPVESYEAGIQRVLDRSSDVFFGDRAILMAAVAGGPSADELIVLNRLFTHEPLALAIRRNDDDFRLAVDRTLSRLFRSDDFRDAYTKWFGEPDESTQTFFRLSALPE